MTQKYKFFIRQNAIIITNDADFNGDYWLSEKEHSLDKIVDEILIQFKQQGLESNLVVWVADSAHLLSVLLERSKSIVAGGGYVLNGQNQLLMIHRRGFWDLPKGKQERNESIEGCALREVEEECGVSGLHIVSEPLTTYHLFTKANRPVIKVSVWFQMTTGFTGAPTPQYEEDIEKALWVNLPVSNSILAGAFPLIRDVVDHFGSG